MPFTLSGEGRSLINRSNSNDQNSDLLLTEKQNLLCVFKLVIKDLLDSSLKRERILENEFFPLRHFFIVLEHILLHGYIGKKSFSISSSSNNRKDLWPIIELISRKSTDIHITEISMSSKEMTNIRTSLGRVRAWLRLALMQKRLADYFKILIEQKQELNDLYDHQSILLSDESTIITGLLVGLNVLDFNFCLKDLILDYPIESLIHYHLYLRERRLSTKNTHPPGAILDPQDDLDDYSSLSSSSPISTRRIIEPNDETLLVNPTNDVESFDETNNSDIPSSISDQRMKNILDQKNYLEELNRNLQKTVTNLQDRLQTLEQTYKSSLEDKTRLKELEEQLAKSQTEKEQMQLTNQRKIETLNADIQVERETYQRSRTGFDSIYNELQKKYEDERLSKQKTEDVYQTQLTQNKNQTEIIKNLERELESQMNLCNQLKGECTHLTEKLQIETTRCDEKEQQLQSIEKENQYLRQTISELEANSESINKEIHKLTAANEKLHRKTNKLDADKISLETDLNVEQDFHQRLQSALNNEKEKVSMLQLDLHELTLMKQEYESYKKEMTKRENDYEKRIQEHDKTIQELAFKLELSIKREDEFREKDGLRSLPWMKDTNVKECGQCKKDFNPLRRRHHCRNCGQIFCEGCASMKLALSSSSKPVRVCDTCRNHLLAECAVNSS